MIGDVVEECSVHVSMRIYSCVRIHGNRYGLDTSDLDPKRRVSYRYYWLRSQVEGVLDTSGLDPKLMTLAKIDSKPRMWWFRS